MSKQNPITPSSLFGFFGNLSQDDWLSGMGITGDDDNERAAYAAEMASENQYDQDGQDGQPSGHEAIGHAGPGKVCNAPACREAGQCQRVSTAIYPAAHDPLLSLIHI